MLGRASRLSNKDSCPLNGVRTTRWSACSSTADLGRRLKRKLERGTGVNIHPPGSRECRFGSLQNSEMEPGPGEVGGERDQINHSEPNEVLRAQGPNHGE